MGMIIKIILVYQLCSLDINYNSIIMPIYNILKI